MKQPVGFEKELSGYRAVVFDGGSIPIGWGFAIEKRLGVERFQALGKFGDLVCVEPIHSRWVLVTKWLTTSEAIEQFGPVTNVALWPRGGFRSVTYGTTVLTNRRFKPE